MKIIILLLAVSLSVALAFLIAFIWSAKTGQFEDNFADANRILFDNKTSKKDK
ncbi:MAG: cbb3-type cytochrome oxidase assembly protein CcoS [Bacteroidetes bacterium]|jgi:cbb3-type cytochrome oxidase maturation protein|nr:cbb3-type cytochrome oxidase assembly protein CcoS [Bacteroidota bacterium]